MQRRQRQIQPTDLKAKAVGVIVRELREQAGESQERLSGQCGFDRTYISRVERTLHVVHSLAGCGKRANKLPHNCLIRLYQHAG